MRSVPAFLCTFIWLLVFCLFVADATALQAAPPSACTVISEEIIPLRVPSFDVPILWKKTLGGPGPDIPVDTVPLADGGFILIGESTGYDKDKGLGTKQLYLARLDINGKVVWEKHNSVKGFAQAAAGVAVKDRLAILSRIDAGDKDKPKKNIEIDFYDGLGALKSTVSFSDKTYDLIPGGMAGDSKKKILTLALWAVNRSDAKDNFTILKQVSEEGKEISSRQYLPGVPNHLESFKKTPDGDFIGSGQILNNGVTSGWIFYVDGDSGNLRFQRPYARGTQSNLRSVTPDGQGNFIVIGDSIPSGEGSRAAWLMKINGRGEPLWQKYVQGRYAFLGRDVAVVKDGRILALLNARPLSSTAGGGREHSRLLTFTPGGNLQGDEALIEGANAQGVSLFTRDNSRIITGITQTGLADYALARDQKSAGFDYWVLGLPKLAPYNDLCGGGRSRDSFDDAY